MNLVARPVFSPSTVRRSVISPAHVEAAATFRTNAQLSAPGSVGGNFNWHYVKKYYFSDPATYPIILIICGAVTMLTFASARQLKGNPDVRFDKHERALLIQDNDDEGEKHYDNALRRHAAQEGSTRVGWFMKALSSKKDD